MRLAVREMVMAIFVGEDEYLLRAYYAGGQLCVSALRREAHA